MFKDIFARFWMLIWWIIFHHFKVVFHFLLVYPISSEMSVVVVFFIPLYVPCLSSSDRCKISLSWFSGMYLWRVLVWLGVYMYVCVCMCLCVHVSISSLGSRERHISVDLVFIAFRKFWGVISLPYPSGIPYIHILDHLALSYWSPKLYSLIHCLIFPLFFRLYCFNYSVFKFIDLYLYINLIGHYSHPLNFLLQVFYFSWLKFPLGTFWYLSFPFKLYSYSLFNS